MKNVKATIIILDYMKGAQVVENVKSINQQTTHFDFKIIVIDNSCNQENAKYLYKLSSVDNVSLVINTENLGYTKAHNSVNHMIEGDYILIVNPDIEWKDPEAIEKMIDYMDNNMDTGILGPKQVEADGKVAMSVRAFPRFYLQVARRTILRKLPFLKKRVSHDEMRHLDYEKIQEVDWLQSSCVVVRRDLWQSLGGLNEEYFLFMSDVELCFESWKKGYKVIYFPGAEVQADGKRVSAGGMKQFFRSWVMRQHVKDSLKYRKKHFFDKNPRL